MGLLDYTTQFSNNRIQSTGLGLGTFVDHTLLRLEKAT